MLSGGTDSAGRCRTLVRTERSAESGDLAHKTSGRVLIFAPPNLRLSGLRLQPELDQSAESLCAAGLIALLRCP
jgi:hypothetical protein